jgi:hypothetical protein
MAQLVIKSAVTINTIGTEVYIEFFDATGEYEETENPGGFGPPNPSRSSLAMILFAEHLKEEANVEADVLFYDPQSVQSYTVAMSRNVNGVLSYNILAIPIFDPGLTYEEGNVVYDNQNPSESFIKEMVSGEWVTRTPKDIVGNDTIAQLNDYTFPVPDAIQFVEELNARKMLMLRTYVKHECEKDEYEPLRTQFEYAEGLLKSATNSFCAQAYNEAQIDIEEIFEFGVEIDLLEEHVE